MSEPQANAPAKRVLIVSPSFPPMNAADLQRVRMSLPHYRENGWEPIVLAIDPRDHGGTREDALIATIPNEIAVYHCGAFSKKWTRWFGVGNLGLRSWAYLFVAGARIIRREKIDLVFFSNTQFFTFTLGRIWQRILGVPYVVDLQDPWRTDYYQGARKKDRPGGWKYGFAHAQAKFLESWSFRKMSGLMSVSQHYIDDLRKRYPWFSNVPAEVIGFGASKADQVAAAKLSLSEQSNRNDCVRVVYTGVAGPVMQPAMAVLFDGLNAFRKNCSSPLRLRFDFFGTSYAGPVVAAPSVVPVASQFDCDDLVFETPTRLGHLQSLREQMGADILLLLGTGDPAYSPSKLYPCYLANRPMLAVVLAGSNLEELLRELSCAVVVTFGLSGPDDRTRDQVAAFFAAALAGFPSGSLPLRNEALFRQEYLAESLTRRQCALFDRALLNHSAIAKSKHV